MYITKDKLSLNKLLHVSTNASGVRLLSAQWGGFHPHVVYVSHCELCASKVEPWVASASVPKLLQMLLAA
jgi:hypothetical protein